jgi:hypothetical protein
MIRRTEPTTNKSSAREDDAMKASSSHCFNAVLRSTGQCPLFPPQVRRVLWRPDSVAFNGKTAG